jgi:hypothetical protein
MALTDDIGAAANEKGSRAKGPLAKGASELAEAAETKLLFAVRIWLPDRPGALGAVASRIGAVKGDLVGIDILERGAGRAIDELLVELPSAALVQPLIRELQQVDGVDVEDVRPLGAPTDSRLDALDTAIALVEAHSVEVLLRVLANRACKAFEADWASVLDHRSEQQLASVGSAPDAAWIGAFLAGSQASVRASDSVAGPSDVAWATLVGADLTLVMGRSKRPFRSRERQQATALVRIADARWLEMMRAGN